MARHRLNDISLYAHHARVHKVEVSDESTKNIFMDSQLVTVHLVPMSGIRELRKACHCKEQNDVAISLHPSKEIA